MEPFGQPGRLETAIWTARKAPEEAIWTAREAPGNHLDSPGGSREPFGRLGRLQNQFGQPGRLQGTIWDHSDSSKDLRKLETPGTSLAAREAPGNDLDSPGGSRERLGQPGRHQKAGKAILCYGYKAARREAKKAVV